MLAKRKQLDVLVSVIILIFCAVVFYLSLRFPEMRTRVDPIGSRGFSQLSVGLMAAMAISIIVLSMLNKTEDGEKPSKITPQDFFVLLKFIVVMVFYICAIRYVGYFVSTLLFTMFCMWWMGVRKPMSILVVGAAATLVIYLIFGLFFRADLPSGFLI